MERFVVARFTCLSHQPATAPVAAEVAFENLFRRQRFNACAVDELTERVQLMTQKRGGRRRGCQSRKPRAELGGEMKAARKLVDELALHHTVSISRTGIFYGPDVKTHRQQRLLLNTVGSEPQQREDLFHSHSQLMRGIFLMRYEPRHVILRTFAELVQQTLQMPPREAAGEGAAAFHDINIQHGGPVGGKKEFFTFVREICQKV